jgi:hypothetical protein
MQDLCRPALASFLSNLVLPKIRWNDLDDAFVQGAYSQPMMIESNRFVLDFSTFSALACYTELLLFDTIFHLLVVVLVQILRFKIASKNLLLTSIFLSLQSTCERR